MPTATTLRAPERLDPPHRRPPAAGRSLGVRWSFLGGSCCCCSAAVALVALGVGQGEDAALRQQVRVPDPGRPARRARRGSTRWRVGQRSRAGSLQDPRCGRAGPYAARRAVHLHRAGAPLLPAATRPSRSTSQVNLVAKDERKAQSHDIASASGPRSSAIAAPLGRASGGGDPARPAGARRRWWRRSTGPSAAARDAYAQQVRRRLRSHARRGGRRLVLERRPPRRELGRRPREGGAARGAAGSGGGDARGWPARARRVGPAPRRAASRGVPIVLRLPRGATGRPRRRCCARACQATRGAVPLGELVAAGPDAEAPEHLPQEPACRSATSSRDVAGEIESPVYAILALNRKLDDAALPDGYVPRLLATQPPDTERAALKWDGEWHITLEVFRDLGHRLRRGARADLRAGGRLVPELHHPAGDHGCRSPQPDRHPAGALRCSAPSSPPPA